MRDQELTATNSGPPVGGKSRGVYLLLRDEIAKGARADGAALPGEQALAREYGVSRVTIRRALEALAQDGLVEKRVGAGSVVRAARLSDGAISADMATLIPQIVEMGKSTTARLLSVRYAPPPAAISAALGMVAGDKAQIAERVRLLDRRPFSYLTTFVPERIARNYSEADLATTPLYRLLEQGGARVESATQSVSATLAAPDAAEALDVSVGSALLSLTRVVRDASGAGVEHLTALYRPDMFRLEMNLAHVGDDGARHWEPVIGAEPL